MKPSKEEAQQRAMLEYDHRLFQLVYKLVSNQDSVLNAPGKALRFIVYSYIVYTTKQKQEMIGQAIKDLRKTADILEKELKNEPKL
jgi:hypothetical protein